jgi:hypothetical protein
MASTGDADAGDAPAESAAAALRSASFVHVVAHADGASVAAAGLLAGAADALGVPFQVSVARTAAGLSRRVAAVEDATAVVAGAREPGADASLSGPEAPLTAARAVRAVGADPDSTLALAGGSVAGVEADGTDGVEHVPVERRPGVGLPTTDIADGLAHTTLVHADVSGDPEAAAALLADLDVGTEPTEAARRRLASALALDASVAAAEERGVAALGRALHPLGPAGQFETVAGYGDVLDAVAREAPGTAVALTLGYDARGAALDAWRAHARRAHAAVRAADPARHAGLTVARDAAPVWTVARLLRDFRSPEPAALAVGADEAALAGTPGTGAAEALSTAAAECSGSAGGGDARAYATFEAPVEEFVSVVRGVL